MINSTFSRFLLVCSLCFTMSAVRAQYVAIPDSNFGNWLNNNGYSSCLTGNSVSGYQLDTTCAATTGGPVMNCTYSNINDLTGVKYFTEVTTLDCHLNDLTFLPDLPPYLQVFDCFENYNLTTMPVLPASLTWLNMNQTAVSSIILPPALQTLYCIQTGLRSLPALPASLGDLDCEQDSLTSLPNLPASLIILDCGDNVLTVLPALPNSLSELSCGNNPITSLPTLPDSLRTLDFDFDTLLQFPHFPVSLFYLSCSSTNIDSLPSALPSRLISLSCSANPLAHLPALPATVSTLYINSDLYLTSLPDLPQGLNYLDVSGDSNLTCLPRIFSDSLYDFYINGSGISCLPSRFNALFTDVNLGSYPLCDPSSGCDFYYNLAGNVHFDNASTCVNDSLSPGPPLTNVKVELMSNGQVVQQFYCFNSGGYSFETDSLTTFTVAVDTAGLPLSIACPVSEQRTVTLSPYDTAEANESFGANCIGADYGVASIFGTHFRPTSTSAIHIVAGNMLLLIYNADCVSGVSGTVTTTLSGSIQYLGPAPGAISPSMVSGNVLTYNFSDLDALMPGDLDILVMTDSNAIAGTGVCITVDVTPAVPDLFPADNALVECYTVVHSWDPNEKTVFPLDTFEAGHWLTYTVNFQNTGTDTAYTVVIEDTLSPSVDASTFQFIASDHKVVTQVFGNVVMFTFPKINLVDSMTNAPLSAAWVQYKVKASANLPIGTQVQNTAYVYFDLNPAVVTNTTTNVVDTFQSTLGVSSLNTIGAIHLYPNPNKGSFTLQTSNSIGATYTISDMLGNMITQQTIRSDKQQIELSEVAEGVYTLVVKGAKPIRFEVVR